MVLSGLVGKTISTVTSPSDDLLLVTFSDGTKIQIAQPVYDVMNDTPAKNDLERDGYSTTPEPDPPYNV